MRYTSNPGNRYRKSYVGKRDRYGKLTLQCTGRVDQYAIIQADKMSTDINVILSRFVDGDSTVLSRMQAVFGDFTGLPDSYIGMVNMIEEGKRNFEELPPQMRAVFGNDFVRMLASFDDELARTPADRATMERAAIDKTQESEVETAE